MLKDATDVALSIRTSDEEISNWDRTRITDALVRETDLEQEVADKVSLEVEKQVFATSIKTITTSLVRELVNAKLIELGLEKQRLKHDRLGVPLYDVDYLMVEPNRENANVPHGPEATNLTLAEEIKKEYALRKVFSKEVTTAHLKGDLHLHDLGFIDRPYCSGQSLEYVKKFGLNLPNAMAIAKPANRGEVLLAHVVKFAAALQCHYAGAIGWDAINIFFAPYLVDKSPKEIKQLAQMLIFEFSQQAVARGGQAIFTDINLYWEVPKHFENTPAIGPGGEYTGKTYGEYSKEAQAFVWALFDVYNEGDGSGRPFMFPKPLLHITEKFFQTPRHEEFLNHVCGVAAKMGSPYFVFDRGSTAKISECCRLSFKLKDEDLEDAKFPWKMRYCALQNVTLNLPRVGYTCKGEKVFERITRLFNLAVKAHLQKQKFIKKILSLGSNGPLALLAMNKDGSTYLKLDRVSYLIGMVGLNELVKTQCDREMHESDEAFKFGLSVIAHMKLLVDKACEEHKMHFVLEQTPAESTAYRFARLDLKQFPDKAQRTVNGSVADNSVYYSNSTYLNTSASIDPITRIAKEGLFHPLIEAGALCLDYNERILIAKKSGAYIESLGKFVEEVLNSSDQTILPDGSVQAKVAENVYTLGIEGEEGALVPLTHVLKVPVESKKAYHIRTKDRKSIKVTENHILFRLRNGQVEEVPSQCVASKDVLLAQPRFSRKSTTEITISLFKSLLSYEDDITVCDSESSLLEYIKTQNLTIPHTLYSKRISLKELRFLLGQETEAVVQSLNLTWRCKHSIDSLPFFLRLDYKLGLLLGFFLAEGHCMHKQPHAVGFTLHKDEQEFAAEICSLTEQILNRDFNFKVIQNYMQATKNSKSLAFLFSSVLDVGQYAHLKQIPEQLFQLENSEYLRGIVEGLFCGDGLKANAKNGTSITLTSEKLIEQLQVILTTLGVSCVRIRREVSNKNAHTRHELFIGSRGFKNLLAEIPHYAKSLKNVEFCKLDRELITWKSTPFEDLYNRYLKGRAGVAINRRQLYYLGQAAHTHSLCVSTALKFTNNWIAFFEQVLKNTGLQRHIFLNTIQALVPLHKDTVGRIVRDLQKTQEYVKNNQYSKISFERVRNLSFRTEVLKELEVLNSFKEILNKCSFTVVDSTELLPSMKYAYDITVKNHKFSTVNGILCHNTHVWLGESQPSAESLANFVEKVFRNTKNDQIAFSPEFTTCCDCEKTARGLLEACPYCGSKNVEGITRITGYFSKVSSWNRGKLAELRDRARVRI